MKSNRSYLLILALVTYGALFLVFLIWLIWYPSAILLGLQPLDLMWGVLFLTLILEYERRWKSGD